MHVCSSVSFSVRVTLFCFCLFFFFNHTPTTEIYTLSLHDALPIFISVSFATRGAMAANRPIVEVLHFVGAGDRSEEHTSELQSLRHLVCRLLLEKKKKNHKWHEATVRTSRRNDSVSIRIRPSAPPP